MYNHKFQQHSISPLLCALSTKCFHMLLLMSLTAMLIEGIRYFDKTDWAILLILMILILIKALRYHVLCIKHVRQNDALLHCCYMLLLLLLLLVVVMVTRRRCESYTDCATTRIVWPACDTVGPSRTCGAVRCGAVRHWALVILQSAGRDSMTPITHGARRVTRRGWS